MRTMPRAGSDLNAVAAFVKVVDAKTFRAAARALGVPKSTISLKVAQLEDRLGVRLLERTTRTLRLTDAGGAYYRHVAPALEALGDADQVMTDLQAQPSGRLRLTAPVETGYLRLGPIIAEYMRRHPAVQVEVDLTNRRVDLIEEGFDLAIRAGALPDSSLIARRLGGTHYLRLYASPAYLRQYRAPRRPEDLSGHRVLCLNQQNVIWHFRRKRRVVQVKVNPHAVANSLFVLRDLAAAGLGIARLPELVGKLTSRGGELRTVLDDYCPAEDATSVVYPSARNLSPKVRAFIEVLEQSWEDTPLA
jgi:DNA-binding transcriptional LysR family regulator